MVCFDFSVVYERTVLYLFSSFKYVYHGIIYLLVQVINISATLTGTLSVQISIVSTLYHLSIFKAISFLGHCSYNVIPAKFMLKNKCISDCKYYTYVLYTYAYGLMRIKICI